MSAHEAKKNELLNKIKHDIEAYCDEFFKFEFNPSNPGVKLHEPTFGAAEIYAATETMLSTYVTMGKKVRRFEEQYADMFGHRYGVTCNSGSSANLLAISTMTNPVTRDHLRPGDEVIVPALSWSTTIWPLVQHNLIPVAVDCDPKTYNLDLNKLEAAIGPKTRAIMLVHVYGNPCDMDGLMAIAKKHNLIVLEDSCESMGAYYDGKAVGSFGHMGMLSFFFSHHITTLEGGIVVTDDLELAETMRIIRAHGWHREADNKAQYTEKYPHIDPRFIFVNLGYNIRITEVQAAMGMEQLPKLNPLIDNRRETAAYYQKHFAKYSDFFEFQQETPKGKHVWFGFGMVVKENAPFTRDEITAFLQKNHIETRPIIAGNMARHPGFQMFPHRIGGDLSAADRIMQRGFAIGNHHAINSQACQYILEMFDAFMREKGIVGNKAAAGAIA